MKFTAVIYTLRRISFTISQCRPSFTSVSVASKLSFETMPAEKKPFSRLPTDVIPVNYNLWLKPCLDTFVFDGKQVVNVQVSLFALNVSSG